MSTPTDSYAYPALPIDTETKRMVVTVTVPNDMDDATLADIVNMAVGGAADATAWEWGLFWLDHEEGLVGPDGDGTTEKERA